MVNIKRSMSRILGGSEAILEELERRYQEEKNRECEDLYNDILAVLVDHKATIQNVVFVFRMIEWGYLRGKYLQLVEGTVQIPEGSIPVPKMKPEEPAKKDET
ncbi:MAG: hypothetical protein ACTSPB_02460 [Candidatus Thorarchaeota archaeon]